MKFFTMCQRGNVRSAPLAYVLKDAHGQEAIAGGWQSLNHDTIRMLCAWADYVVVMQPAFKKYIPDEFQAKVRVVDVGQDVYGTPMHPHLMGFLKSVTREWEHAGWKI